MTHSATSQDLLSTLDQLWQQGLELYLKDDQLQFKAPPNVVQGENLDFIKRNKADIIAVLLQQPELMQGFPVTQGQAAMYTAQQLDNDNPKFNLVSCVLLKQAIDSQTLAQCLKSILLKHPILTASFDLSPLPSHGIRQTLSPDKVVTIEQLSVNDSVEDCTRQWAAAPFNLKNHSLIKAALIENNNEYYFALSCHHLVCDFIGLQNVLNDIQTLYKQASNSDEKIATPLACMDIKAHVIAEQGIQSSHDAPANLQDIFKENSNELSEINFSGFKASLDQQHSNNEFKFSIDASLAQEVINQSKQSGSSLFINTASAFSILLARLSSDKAFIINTPIANRFGDQIHGAGHFTNPLPLLADFSHDNLSFQGIQQQLKSRLQALIKSQNYPAEQLQDTYNYASNVAFSFNRLDIHAFDGALYKKLILAEQLSYTHDLVLTGIQLDSALNFSFRYNKNRLCAQAIEKFAALFEEILALSIDEKQADNFPTQHCFLNKDEQEKIAEANSLATPYPATNLAYQFFEQVNLTPNYTALTIPASAVSDVDKTSTFTYQALGLLAKQYQHWISQQDIQEKDVIAILGKRDQHYLAITLAGLSLGLVVAPIDNIFPEERINYMLKASNAKLAFNTNSVAIDKLYPSKQAQNTRWVNVHQHCLPNFNSVPDTLDNTAIKTSPEHICFIFFTSGSTGLPKAVPVTQAAVARLSHQKSFLNIKAKEVCLFSSNISFDATNIEIWSTLFYGGELLAIDKDILLAPSLLHSLCTQHNIQHTFLTTVLFNTLISHRADFFKDFKTVLFGGESSDNYAIQQCCIQGKPEQFLNVYGPTENGSLSTFFVLDETTMQEHDCIGRGYENSSAWVCDQFGNLQIPGGAGELYVGGDGVTPGYLEQDDVPNIATLNKEKFIADTLSHTQGRRLYKTGDFVYADRQANIYFIGRADDQIKIRGFRIQLAEIEQQLAAQPDIDHAIVIADKTTKNTQLIAYYVPSKNSHTNIQSIQQQLTKSLPAYMLPHHYIELDELPITPNGKLDKRKLPALTTADIDINLLDSNHPKLTPTQSLLVSLWQEQCGLAVCDISDNFFEVGGNSLLAVKLSSFICDEINRRESSHLENKPDTSPLYAKDIFNYPSIKALAEFIDTRTDEHNTVFIEKQLIDHTQPYLASLSQQRLWFIQELQSDSAVYNMPLVLKLHNALAEKTTVASLETALAHLVNHHLLLQASFIDQQGSAYIQATKPSLSVESINCQSQAELDKAFKLFSSRPFSLEQAPLVKVQLFQLMHSQDNGRDVYLGINLHHIIADGWSAQLLLKDLFEQLTTPHAISNTPIIQYSDFATWQHSHAAEAIYSDELIYWKEALDQAPSSLNLPIDKQRPAKPTGEGGAVTFSFNAAESQIIKTKAKQSNISLFSLFAACYQLLLSRYCNQHDICIGFPVHGRDNPQTHPLVGLFTNNLVLRQKFTSDNTIKELLQASSEKTIAALAHQQLPFDKLLEQLDIEKTQHFIPLLQASFSCEEQSLPQLIDTLSQKQASLADSHWHVAKYDLHLSCFSEGDIQAQLEFSTDIFNKNTIEQMTQHFKSLCLVLCQAEENTQVLSLNFLSNEEIQQQVSATSGLNASQFNHPVLGTFEQPPFLHQLFEQQVEQHPNAMAVSDNNFQLSYSQLDKKSNQLAHYLIEQGTQAGDAIACLIDRSVTMSVALLAILKTGACYVPLLNDMPAERINFIIDDTATKLVLFSSFEENKLENCHAFLSDLSCESITQTIASKPLTAPKIQSTNNTPSLLNIIYTSGSTGQPKGVMVTQAGIINRLLWMQRYTPLNQNDKVLQKTPYNFDVSVWELFWPLMVGASIHYLEPEKHKEPDAIQQAILEHNISTIHFVPSMLQAFNLTHDINLCLSIKRVFTSGEALQTQQANDFLQQLPNTQLHNLYGPTEASIDVSYYACTANSQLSNVPIGKVIDNMRLYILDQQKQLLPLGSAGDLYIAGVGLAAGYLNRPEQNEAAFFSNPFKQEHDSSDFNRMYKTGDIARYLADGNIEYLGRSDNQIKLRGLRIELGEIENRLLEQDAIEQSVVLVQLINNEPQLVAFYVSQHQETIDDSTLRQALAQHLPAYMLPFCFIPLSNLPLSPNGKLDRKQLPNAEDLLQSQFDYVAPQNETEQAIATMFQQVLNIEQVGIHDNFFLLGGHSLLATKLAASIRSHFECPFELKEIFDHPTVYDISLAIIEQNMMQLGMDDLDDDDLLALLEDL